MMRNGRTDPEVRVGIGDLENDDFSWTVREDGKGGHKFYVMLNT